MQWKLTYPDSEYPGISRLGQFLARAGVFTFLDSHIWKSGLLYRNTNFEYQATNSFVPVFRKSATHKMAVMVRWFASAVYKLRWFEVWQMWYSIFPTIDCMRYLNMLDSLKWRFFSSELIKMIYNCKLYIYIYGKNDIPSHLSHRRLLCTTQIYWLYFDFVFVNMDNILLFCRSIVGGSSQAVNLCRLHAPHQLSNDQRTGPDCSQF